MFWVSVLFISAFAFLPSYMGVFFGGTSGSNPAISEDQVELSFAIEGMTCEACAVGVRVELADVPGVSTAEVLYDEKRASVHLEQGATTTNADLLAAVERAGYRAILQTPMCEGSER